MLIREKINMPVKSTICFFSTSSYFKYSVMYCSQTVEMKTLLYLNQSIFETTRMVTHLVIPLMTTCPCEMVFISTTDGASPQTPCCLHLCIN